MKERLYGGSVVADVFRADLQAIYGYGSHGFSLNPPEFLADGQVHVVTAKIRSTGVTLGGGPKTVACSGYIEEWIDTLNCSTVGGWVRHTGLPNTSITLNLWRTASVSQSPSLPEVVETSFLANSYRSDIAAIYGTNGYNGFSIATPSGLTGYSQGGEQRCGRGDVWVRAVAVRQSTG